MKEDKQMICNRLCETLKETRDQEDLAAITYEKNSAGYETATLTYINGGARTINVTMDSGVAMIRDIMRTL